MISMIYDNDNDDEDMYNDIIFLCEWMNNNNSKQMDKWKG